MKHICLMSFLYLFVVITSGCASVTGTTNQSISIQTRSKDGKEVTGSACELTNNRGKWFVTSPGSVTVTRSNDDMQVLCNKQGLEPGRASIVSEIKASMFGNILIGGIIGAAIDHGTGAAYEYPAFIQVMMGMFTRSAAPKPTEEQSTNSQPNGQPTAKGYSEALPPVTASAPQPAQGKGGEFEYYVFKAAAAENCKPQKSVMLTAKGPGFESYSVTCPSGDTLAVRCDFGTCRVLK